MIWLYLLVLGLSVTGLFVVYAEWRRGVRQGLVGPLATFAAATLVTGLALTWLIALGGEGGSSVRWTDTPTDGAAEPVEGVALGRVAAGNVQVHGWWSWLATGVAGYGLTAVSVFFQIGSMVSASRRHREQCRTIERLRGIQKTWCDAIDGLRGEIGGLRRIVEGPRWRNR